jgi:IS30 family transposase
MRPPPRRRSRLGLILLEREEISRGVVAGQSIRYIAAGLGRAPSTVSRELHCNGGERITGPAMPSKPLGTERVVRRRASSPVSRRWCG